MSLAARTTSPGSDDGQSAPLWSLIEATGATLFEVLCGDVDTAPPVRSIAILDPTEAGVDHAAAVVLAVGVTETSTIEHLLRQAIHDGASCVVLRDVTDLPDHLVALVDGTSLVVLTAVGGIPWNQVSTSLSRGLDHELARGFQRAGASRHHRDQSLADLANALDTALDAPVTIEDLNSNVIGFSDDQMRGDVSRHETILHRAVSSRHKEILVSNGTFKRLYATAEPIVVDLSDEPGVDVPRIAIRIASGHRVLGSIWVATRTPPSEIDVNLLKSTAAYAGDLIDAANGGIGNADADHRQFLVSQLLGTEREARSASETLGILHDSVYLLTASLASSTYGEATPAARVLDKVAGSLNLLVLSSSSKSVAAVLNGHVFGILPVRADVDDESAKATVTAVARRFAHRVDGQDAVHVAISQRLPSPLELGAAKSDGLRTLGMMARSPDRDPPLRIVHTDDAFLDVMLLDLHDRLLSRRPPISTPVSELIDYDALHGTDFISSLVAFFREFGSVKEASDSVHVHANTFRYRLRRIDEISGIDVADHESRLGAMLELRIRRLLD